MTEYTWLVPCLPTSTWKDGVEDHLFLTTVGWYWEEAMAVAKRMPPGTTMHVAQIAPANLILPAGGITVVSEGLLPHLVGRDIERLYLRSVCSPGDNEVWKLVAERIQKGEIKNICTIGERECDDTRAWVRQFRDPPNVEWMPIGAAIPEEVHVGAPSRRGVAWLGRPLTEKRVPVVIEAAAKAKVPLYLGLLNAGPVDSSGLEEIQETVKRTNGWVAFGRFGLRKRMELLQNVRVVATASHADSQWMPGTEIRACGGIAIAERWTDVEKSNGDRIAYHDGTAADLARLIVKIHEDNEHFSMTAMKQFQHFCQNGFSQDASARALVRWLT